MENCVGVPFQALDPSVAGGKKLDGYALRNQAWTTCKPGQDTSEFRNRLQHSAGLLGRTNTQERYGRWNSAHHLGTSTYTESPKLSTRIVPNEVGSGCLSPRESSWVPTKRAALHTPRTERQAQKALLNGDSTSNLDTVSFKCSPRQSPRIDQNSRLLKNTGGHRSQNGGTKRKTRCEMDSSRPVSEGCESFQAKTCHVSQAHGDSERSLSESTQGTGNEMKKGMKQQMEPLGEIQNGQRESALASRKISEFQHGESQLPVKQPSSVATPRSTQQDVAPKTPRSVVPRLVGLNNLSKAVSNQTIARSPDMASSRSTEVLSSRNHFSHQSFTPLQDATSLSTARVHVNFLGRVLDRGSVLHTGGGRLTQEPRGPRYSCDVPKYQNFDEDGKSETGKGTAAKSGQTHAKSGAPITQEGSRLKQILAAKRKPRKGKDTTVSRQNGENSDEVASLEDRLVEKTSARDGVLNHVVNAGSLQELENSQEAPMPSASLFLQSQYSKDGKDTETTASSCDDHEESDELEDLAQDVISNNPVNEQSVQQRDNEQETQLHSASQWLSMDQTVSTDCPNIPAKESVSSTEVPSVVRWAPTKKYKAPQRTIQELPDIPAKSSVSETSPEELPGTPRSFQCTQQSDGSPAWDQKGFPVTPTNLHLIDELNPELHEL